MSTSAKAVFLVLLGVGLGFAAQNGAQAQQEYAMPDLQAAVSQFYSIMDEYLADPLDNDNGYYYPPLTRAQERRLQRQQRLHSRMRNYSADPYYDGLWGQDSTPLVNPYQGRILWNPGYGPGSNGNWYAPQGYGFTPPSSKPGIYWAPGHEPGRFGTFASPLPRGYTTSR